MSSNNFVSASKVTHLTDCLKFPFIYYSWWGRESVMHISAPLDELNCIIIHITPCIKSHCKSLPQPLQGSSILYFFIISYIGPKIRLPLKLWKGINMSTRAPENTARGYMCPGTLEILQIFLFFAVYLVF